MRRKLLQVHPPAPPLPARVARRRSPTARNNLLFVEAPAMDSVVTVRDHSFVYSHWDDAGIRMRYQTAGTSFLALDSAQRVDYEHHRGGNPKHDSARSGLSHGIMERTLLTYSTHWQMNDSDAELSTSVDEANLMCSGEEQSL